MSYSDSVITYLSLEEFAARRGKSYSFLRDCQTRDLRRGEWVLLPTPDAVTGATGERPRYGWLAETCDGWTQVGRGTRTDLR